MNEAHPVGVRGFKSNFEHVSTGKIVLSTQFRIASNTRSARAEWVCMWKRTDGWDSGFGIKPTPTNVDVVHLSFFQFRFLQNRINHVISKSLQFLMLPVVTVFLNSLITRKCSYNQFMIFLGRLAIPQRPPSSFDKTFPSLMKARILQEPSIQYTVTSYPICSGFSCMYFLVCWMSSITDLRWCSAEISEKTSLVGAPQTQNPLFFVVYRFDRISLSRWFSKMFPQYSKCKSTVIGYRGFRMASSHTMLNSIRSLFEQTPFKYSIILFLCSCDNLCLGTMMMSMSLDRGL